MRETEGVTEGERESRVTGRARACARAIHSCFVYSVVYVYVLERGEREKRAGDCSAFRR